MSSLKFKIKDKMEKSKRYQQGMEIIGRYEDKSENPSYSITFDSLMDLDSELVKLLHRLLLGILVKVFYILL